MKYLFFTLSYCGLLFSQDPLPSWNSGKAKEAIVGFIKATTDPLSPHFVPQNDRIATFDQDGTLWVEHPIYTQLVYCLEREHATIDQNIKEIAAKAFSGMSTELFQQEVASWLTTAKDPRWKRSYLELTYKPMQEVLRYFRDSGYKTYIVTGGGQDFVRVYSEKVYGIGPEQVVGSAGHTKYSDKGILIKEPMLLLNDDFAGKPEGIHFMIGKRPYAAFGNSIGDKDMLEYTKSGKGTRLAMLVLHDDAEREYAYGPATGLPDTKIGTFSQELYEKAQKDGWIVISMKNDWSQIFYERTDS